MLRFANTKRVALAAAWLAAGCATSGAIERDHESLVAAERAFARHALESDVRTAFLAAFADDGIWMTPAPMRLRDAYAARPAPADPRAVQLEWAPVASGISASGDFGFTTGPSTLSWRDGSRPPQHGAYFSVWRRDAGRWRVVLDAGIVSDHPIPPAALLPSPAVHTNRVPAPASMSSLHRIERIATADAFAALLARDARLYRRGPPLHGETAIRAALASTVAFEPAGGDVASSGDLGYTYGAWREGPASGHYVHLWTRDERGDWRIAVALRL